MYSVERKLRRMWKEESYLDVLFALILPAVLGAGFLASKRGVQGAILQTALSPSTFTRAELEQGSMMKTLIGCQMSGG
jgi:hypothetical protein